MNHLNQDVLYDNANSPIGSGFIINKIVNYFQILFCFHFFVNAEKFDFDFHQIHREIIH
jgi:hypothetical protein